MSALPFSTATGADVRVRFCPSPTGTPHVGMVRTALFNWAYARHTGGTMVFRIEDTDAARDSEESYRQLIDALTWLGIDWDEGVETGGPHGPYRQSQRTSIYLEVIEKLKASGHLYESFVTPDEMEARNVANGRDPRQGYDNFERDLTDAQRAEFRAQGRQPSLRLRVPDTDLSFDDLIRGEITFPAGSFTDFVVVRPNGAPLYTFVNPVDDALMGVTHVFRGEDILSSTPRQIALYLALIEAGVTTFIPRFAHMPLVYGEGAKKLSKRDPESNLFHHRERGFIPEGLINYLALLGWSIAADRDVFTIPELVAAFDIVDVNPNPARFDRRRPTRSTATTSGCCPPTTSRDASCRTSPATSPTRRRPSRRRSCGRPLRSCRSGWRCSRKPRGCSVSCSRPTRRWSSSPTRCRRMPTRRGASSRPPSRRSMASTSSRRRRSSRRCERN